MKYFILFTLTLFALSACTDELPMEQTDACDTLSETLTGTYLFYSEMDTSERTIEITAHLGEFESTGISGYQFWFPASPLSGQLTNCVADYSEIMLTEYAEVEREGLPSPGGSPRNYFESMSGHGEYFLKKDSISLFVNYKRAGTFTEDFSGHIFLKKL